MHVSLMTQTLPKKCDDPGMFSIPCSIGDTTINHAMLDLGASINVIPSCVYDSLGIGPLKKSSTIIELADHSNISPKGLVEDVLVQVDGLVFPADFYVLEMDIGNRAPYIMLGRPFMKTTNAIVNVGKGKLTMEFDGKEVEFYVEGIS